MNTSFCIRAWTCLEIAADGTPKLCCWSADPISSHGRPMSIYEQALGEIWNSEHMREVRQAMVEGRRLSACRVCYAEEAAVGASARTRANTQWYDLLTQGQGSMADYAAEAAAHDFQALRPPTQIMLDMGNTCNLACRMCSANASSRIQQDPVHSRWAPAASRLVEIQQLTAGRSHPVGRFSRPGPYYRQPEFLEELLGGPARGRLFYVIGGEPLLIPEFETLLDELIARGMAPATWIGVSTNATVLKPAVLDKLAQCGSLRIGVSLDGTGPVFDYIRYPARWPEVAANLALLRRRLPQATFLVTPTVQAYNVLNLVDLFRFCDAEGLSFSAPPLTGADYLELNVLPPPARQAAMGRLREYADSDCRPENRATVLSVVERLRRLGSAFDPAARQAFLQFTAELDAARGQTLQDSIPDLFDVIAAAPTAG